ncbi:MAG TPA: HD domain-containing phosphohydrolase [Geobacteraceae bacterium]
MQRILQAVSRKKVSEILDEISRRFGLPLVMMDRDGQPVLSVAADGGVTPPPSLEPSLPQKGASAFPIYFNGDLAGSLAAGPATPDGTDSLQAAAFCLENSLRLEAENLDLSAEVVRLYEEQSLIYALSSKLGSEMDVDSICQKILEEVQKILVVQNLCLMLLDFSRNELCTRLSVGRDRNVAAQFRTDAASGLLGEIFAKGEPVTICDIGTDGRPTFPYPVRSIFCVPLVTDGRGIGMLVASDKLSGQEFWSQELKLMAVFALEAAAAIKKAQLYEEISELFVHTVEALASAIDAKDPYTYGHSKRVARFSTAICEEMGMTRKEVRQVELAAILHDIGKIGTPESILQKPDRLTPEEMERIYEHPARGALILSNISEFRDVIKWIRHHHEWYDGKGYPDHIAAEEIPLQARVITIADTFDAMTSDRPYRKGMPANEALGIMEEFAGSQFDPHILRMFRLIYEGGKINSYLKNQEEAGDAM